MKKSKIFLPMMALALVFGLAACGGNNAQSQQSSGGQQSQSSIPAKPKITVTAAGDKKTLVMEETVQLSAKVDDKDLNGANWSSANEKVATVSATGLVTAVAPGEATISAALDGYTKGSITITVTRPAALATLHFEQAEHYSADGWWGTGDDGWSPEYARDSGNASDAKCIAHFGNGDKETLSFTSSAAIKAELVIMMASSNAIDDMGAVMSVKLGNGVINVTGKAFEGGSSSEFAEFSLGEVDLAAGDNALQISFLEASNYPYLDDLVFYSKQQATIAVKEAPAKERIEVQLPTGETELKAYIGEQTQINLTKPTDKTGVTYASDKETVATVDASGKITGVALGTANIIIKKDGMYSARVAVVVEKKVIEGEIRVEAENTSNDLPSGFNKFTDRTTGIQNGHSGSAYITGYNVTEACSLEYEFTSPKAQTMQLVIAGASHYQMSEDFVFGVDCTLKLNGEVVTCPATAKIESNPVMGAPTVEVTIGNVNLKNGANTFVIEFIERAPALDCYRFLPIA